MRRFSLYLLCVVSICQFLTSCELETSDNGDLDGYWHLEQVDTLSSGGVCDYSDLRVFWGVQHKLLSVKDYDTFGNTRGYYFRFNQTGDSLIISEPYRDKWHQDSGGDVPLDEISDTLRHCGFNDLVEHFYKEKMSGNKMVLRNKMLRLRFTKF